MNLKKLRLAFSHADYVTINGAQVRAKIEENSIYLEWTGTETGRMYSGTISQECFKNVKKADNTVWLFLNFKKGGETVLSEAQAPIRFWKRVEMAV